METAGNPKLSIRNAKGGNALPGRGPPAGLPADVEQTRLARQRGWSQQHRRYSDAARVPKLTSNSACRALRLGVTSGHNRRGKDDRQHAKF